MKAAGFPFYACLPPSSSPLRAPSRADPSGLGHAATIYSSVQGPPRVRNADSMCIECSYRLRTSAESCLGVVFLTRDGLERGGDSGSGERRPRPIRGFSREHTLSKGRLGRGEAMVAPESGLGRRAVYDPLSLENVS
jgi:hypothetical protein